jgi:Asp/Glu/hydantoin racemase
MSKRLALIHTVPSLAEQFQGLAAELMPDVETFSVVDEALLRRTIDEGRLTPATTDRLAQLVSEISEADDVDAIMVTCSTLGPAVDAAMSRSAVPLLRVDEPMVRRAVQQGRRVGVLATLSTTLEPTVDLVERVAADEGRPVEVIAHLCEGAFEAVAGGDGDRHDALVRAGLEQLIPRVDVIVLAQASMTRVIDGLPEAPPVPVLSSPRLAVEHAAGVLTQPS